MLIAFVTFVTVVTLFAVGSYERKSQSRRINGRTETKKEDVTHLTNTENKMLEEVFKIQHKQIQGMVASQHHLATAIALPEPEVRKFKGDPLEFKTFLSQE